MAASILAVNKRNNKLDFVGAGVVCENRRYHRISTSSGFRVSKKHSDNHSTEEEGDDDGVGVERVEVVKVVVSLGGWWSAGGKFWWIIIGASNQQFVWSAKLGKNWREPRGCCVRL